MENSAEKSILTPLNANEKYRLTHPVRVVTAASLFDGHDAAINIMRRILQSTGAEVIHLGHNRCVRDIVTAAVQEDAHAIAISSYRGGHVEFFKYTIDLLREQNASHIQVFGGGGGTITPEEAAQLEKYGVKKIYSPEDGRQNGLQGIINDLLRSSDRSALETVDWLSLTQFPTRAKSLAHALTCLEASEEELSSKVIKAHLKDIKELKSKIAQTSSDATVIGITGTGGAGKSSLTDEFVLRLLEREPDSKIAVLAIDPTRQKTGGALLGDRLRMNSLSNPRLFMRSIATREANRSISAITQQAISLFKAADFQWIFVETGGIGQAETPIVDWVDLNIYVMTQEYGAATQLEKINMLDYADMVVLNKFDKEGATDALLEVRKQFRRNHLEFESLESELYPVFGTIASRFADPGVDAAFSHLYALKDAKQKRCPTNTPVDPESSLNFQAIVSKDRVQYLSEISKHVHNYKVQTEKAVKQIREIESLQTTLEEPTLEPATKQKLQNLVQQKQEQLDSQSKALLKHYPELAKQYEGDIFEYQVRGKKLSAPLTKESLSRTKIPRVCPPNFKSQAELLQFLRLENLPGYFPFTAGVFPLKRQGEDPKRMFAGEGTPTRTNKRFHYLCQGEKAKRLSTAFDSVTLYGQDPDERPDIFGKIGESGVSVCSLDDAKKLYAGFDLCDPSVSVSMTINGPAPMLLAFYFNTAIDQKTNAFEKQNGRKPSADELSKIRADVLSTVRGTVQADILKEDQAQNTCIFSTPFALRMMGDMQEFFVTHNVQNYYSVSISGYHIAEAGANPITQLALTLSNGFTYVEYYRSRGMDIDTFAKNLSFFFSNGLDPEYTVIGRVARRIWAIAMRDLYQANERSQKLKYHVQTSGRSLHAQEIAFNDIRTTLQALIAVLDQCNSLHTNAYDEAITTPTEQSVRQAMAIQLILAREFGLAINENPWQGSFFVEKLTDLVEQAVLEEFERLSRRGGVLGAMENQYQRNKIQEESLYYEKLKHSGEFPVVGVNTYTNPNANYEQSIPENLTRASYEEKNEQIVNLRAFHHTHEAHAPQALAALKQAAKQGKNIFAELMNAARVCSLGQMTTALYEVGGEYRRSV